jgi:hypothetical protein
MEQHEVDAEVDTIIQDVFSCLLEHVFPNMTEKQREAFMKLYKKRWCVGCGKSTFSCNCFELDDEDISKL